MREIIFRCWDRARMCMFDPSTGKDSCVKIECGEIMFEETDRYTMMQSTGLKDKNGVLIFEGDILDRSNDHRKNFVAVVEFHNGQFVGVTIPMRNHSIPLKDIQTMTGAEYDEVIGNIYENPELLNK